MSSSPTRGRRPSAPYAPQQLRRRFAFRPRMERLEDRWNPGYGLATQYPVGVDPREVAIADGNHDGHLDLFVANFGTAAGGSVSVLSGSSGFNDFTGTPVGLPGLNPVGVAVGDVNKDGKPDIITANAVSNDISVALSTGGPNPYSAANGYAAGLNQSAVAVGDFNRDGNLDIAVARTSGKISILLGNGTGQFPSFFELAVPANSNHLIVGDFNRDGKPDIALLSPGRLSIMLGQGNGNFTISSLPAELNPTGLAQGDLNRDGSPDIVVSGSNGLTLYVGDGVGGFTAQAPMAVGPNVTGVAIADLNNDGKPDLAASTGNGATVLLGHGDLTFEALLNYGAGTNTVGIAVGDLNLTPDGQPDLAVLNGSTNPATGTISVLLNTAPRQGRGIFPGTPRSFLVAGHPFKEALGDINNDGWVDVVTANTDTNTVSVLLNDKLGGFDDAIASPLPTGNVPAAVAIGDFNGDGNADVIVTNYLDNNVTVMLGDGLGNFFLTAPGSPVSTGKYPIDVQVADFNGDGKLDAVVTNRADGTLTVLLGRGDGSFSTSTTIPVGAGPFASVVADFNGDGIPDIATANNGSGSVSVLLGAGNGTTFTPATGSPIPFGGAIGISANDFNGDGIQDLVVSGVYAAPLGNTVDILLGNGDGQFHAAPFSPFAGGIRPLFLDTGDVNGDGQPDIVIADQADAFYGVPSAVTVLLNRGGGTFQAGFKTFAGPGPFDVKLADTDHDGDLDLVLTDRVSSSVSLVLGNGDGTFQQLPPVIGLGNNAAGPRDAAMGDLNRDGKLDLVTINEFTNSVSVLLGNGDGTFQSATNVNNLGASPIGVTLADVNRDGILDIITANTGADSINVLLGDGAGGFTDAPGSPVSASSGPIDVKVADMNGDGKPDLIYAEFYYPHSVGIRFGNGDGTFQPETNFYNGPFTYQFTLTVADFNGDGKPDVATADRFAASASILLNDGNGGLGPPTRIFTGYGPFGIAAGDVNGDGKIDLAVANQSYGTISVLLGNGDGTFQAPRNFLAGYATAWITIADMDGDGRPDLVAANLGGTNAVVLLGRGDGTFKSGKGFYVTGQAIVPTVGDINGDGVADIVTTSYNPPVATALLGQRNAATSIQIVGAPATTIAGTTFQITVNALTPEGLIDTRYTGTLHFTTSDGQAVIPSDFTFHLRDDGTAVFTVTLKTAGLQTVTLTDTADPKINGSFQVLVNPAVAATFLVTGFPSPVVAGTVGGVTIMVEDLYGNVVTDYTGTVHFTSTDPQAVLPINYTFTGSGNDDGVHSFGGIVLKTAGTQAIAVLDTADPAVTGSQSGIVVNPAAARTLVVTGFPTTVTAGTAGSISITAKDQFGNVASGYRGTVHFTTSDAQGIVPVDYTFTSGDNGAHNFPNGIILKTASPPLQSVTATDINNGTIKGAETGITVNPAATSRITITGFPSPVPAGTVGTVTVTARDAFGNVTPAFLDTVHFTSSDPQAVLPADYKFLVTDNGSHTFSITLKTAGTQSITATDTNAPILFATQSGIVVNPGPVSTLTVTGFPSPTTAGFTGSMTVSAVDQYGNTATNYTGTVIFSSSDLQAVLPGNSTLTNGTRSFTVTLKTAGTQFIKATDSVNPAVNGQESGIVVNPAAASIVLVSGYPSPVTAGTTGTITVTLQDAFGNLATNYAGTVRFTSTDPQAVLPAISAVPGGTGSFSATLKTAGSQKLTVTDTSDSSLTGSQTGITVNPATVSTLTVKGYPSPITAGQSGSFTVTAKDPFGNLATNYTGPVTISTTDPKAMFTVSGTLAGGIGNFPVTFKTSGSQTITVKDKATPALTGSQSGIVVNADVATTLLATGFPNTIPAGTPFTITVSAVDKFGNVATSYNGFIAFSSDDPQAALPTPSSLVQGTGTFTMTLKTVGTHMVTMVDPINNLGTGQGGIVVTAAAPNALVLGGIPNPDAAGTPTILSVRVVDAFGNTATNFNGTISLASSDPKAALPATATITNGIGNVPLTLETVGTQSVSVSAGTSLNAAVTGIVVTPGSAALIAAVSGAGQSAIAGKPFAAPLVARVTDAFGNVVPGVAVSFSGNGVATVTTTSNALGLVSASVTAPATAGNFSVAATAAGAAPAVFDLTATNQSGGTGKQNKPIQIYAVGTDVGGGPVVAVYDAKTGAQKFRDFVYAPSFTGGVRVAVGDVNGDGVDDLIVGAGVGGGPQVEVLDGRTFQVIRSFYAYEPQFAFGLYVAAGDVNGDGFDDIITAVGAGGGPNLKIWDGKTGALLQSYYAYDPQFAVGVRVAAGDVNGDGFADVITAPGPGGGPNVKVFSGTNGATLRSFFAFDPSFAGGVNVAAGDLNGDGIADIIASQSTQSPQVRTFDGRTGSMMLDFPAFSPDSLNNSLITSDPSKAASLGGVSVAVANVTSDSQVDLLVAAGAGRSPFLRTFKGITGAQLSEILAYEASFLGGVFVG